MSNQNNQILEKIKAELAAFEEKRKALVAELQQEFPIMFKDIFATSPKLKSYSWTQYTPYFNDGDTCEFSAHVDDGDVNGVSRVSHYDDDDDAEDIVRIYEYTQLVTEEDVRINKEVAVKSGMSWYENRTIGEQGLKYNEKYDELAANAVSQIIQVLNSIPEDFFKEMFGDHVKVTLNANGTCDVEEYDHD